MTNAELEQAWWEESKSLHDMLARLHGRVNAQVRARKLRLFACACCRRMWSEMTDPRCRAAVEVAERFADGTAERKELTAAGHAAQVVRDAVQFGEQAGNLPACWAAFCVTWLPKKAGSEMDFLPAEQIAYRTPLPVRARVSLLRDVFRNPFGRYPRRPRPWLTWEGGLAVRLAEAAYEERSLPAGTLDNDRLRVLADALEEAGCTDEQLLRHLRGRGTHVRGCWAVDTVLGRT
jgi:hypothetical protein